MTQTHDEQTVERYKNTARNRILNRTLYDLDRIINGHDPEIDAPIKDGVWNRLDKMAIELADLTPQEVSVQEAAHVLMGCLERTWTSAMSTETHNARESAKRAGHKYRVIDREGFRAALRALSEGKQ